MVTPDRRRYRLVGYLDGGRTIMLSGGMPRTIMLAYDHRSEEGINLIRQYVEDYAGAHDGAYPLPRRSTPTAASAPATTGPATRGTTPS